MCAVDNCDYASGFFLVEERGVEFAALFFAGVDGERAAAPAGGAAVFAALVDGVKADVEIRPSIVVKETAHFGLLRNAFTGGEAGGLGRFSVAHEFDDHDAAAREQVGFATA